jgi:iron complex outermembrane receptor protein
MLLRAWNYSINNYLVYMPSDRYSAEAKFYFDSKTLKENYISVNYQYVTKQWRVPTNSDFAPPPPAYSLLGFEIGTSVRMGKQRLDISLAGANLLNEVYRDYLDRFRYFCDAPGRNFTVRIKMPLVIYDKK